MTPISTITTAIDEIIIMRKAKRLTANVREQFNTVEERQQNRETFTNYLNAHPFSTAVFSRFLSHIRELIEDYTEDDVLSKGYF